MRTVLITGSGGLIGGTATRYFSPLADHVVGIDNDMRRVFFGEEASTSWHVKQLQQELPNYIHHSTDIRDKDALARIFGEHGPDSDLVLHTAAQPTHDKAAQIPFLEFEVNANGTLSLLEMARQHCPEAVFIFTSTNKVYGDVPNQLPLV